MARYVSQFLCFFVILGTLSPAFSQRYYGVSKEVFGKSKVQNKEFQWRTFSSPNFEYNFYKGGEQIARNAAVALEKSYPRITDVLGYMPFEPAKIFVFNSVTDINSTNLAGVNSQVENATILDVKSGRVLTAYNKNDSLFHKQLVYNVASIYVYDMLFGGNVRESIESQLLLNLPEWFTSGIAAYIAEPDNSLRFNDFKAAIEDAQNQRLGNIKGETATKVGQSIWHYIALKYGKSNISNILNLTRIIHEEQSSVTSTLGISFSKFLKEWRDFYVTGALPVSEEKQIERTPVVAGQIQKRITDLKLGEVDTDNYEFDQVNIERYKELGSIKPGTAVLAGETGSKLRGQGVTGDAKFTSTKLFRNFLISNDRKIDLLIDPVRQFGIGYGLSVNDLLQNNVFTFSSYFRPSTPLFRSYDYALSYGHYAKKLDYIFKYEKRSLDLESIDSRDAFLFRPLNHLVSNDGPEYLFRRLISQRMSVSAVYPVSNTLKIELTPSVIKNQDLDYSFSSSSNIPSDFYFAPSLSAVFDNSKTNLYGVETGTKAKVVMDRYFHTSNNFKSFNNLYLDIRHYQRIFRGLQVAGRLSYGTSRGNAPKYSFLGGVENSINRTTYRTDEILTGGNSDLKNILFYNFPGTLRGFDFGRLYGNNHLLGNVELRSHMAEVLPQMALSSNLLRNLQFVGFFDIGTAWMGEKGPFSRQNSLNTVITGYGSPFLVEVTNFKNPFLYGFGGGVRTSVLGVFLRADYAFSVEDGELNKPKFHFSVGKDF